MSKDYEYLSDQELNDLIDSIEKDGCAKAPEDMTAEILDFIDETEKIKNSKSDKISAGVSETSEVAIRNHKTFTVYTSKNRNSKKIDFGIYCVKVFGSIAAAIIIMIIVPFAKREQHLPNRDEVIASYETESREEVLSQESIRSRDEVLNGKKYNIFLPDLQSVIDNLNLYRED